MNPRAAALTAVFTILAGCATGPGTRTAGIVEAHHSQVADCKRVGSVYGSASGFHWSRSGAMASARNKALESAAKQDATHVVWQHDEQSTTPEVSGTAYHCPR
ncbi:hypothetical protein ACMDCT_07775 [Halomonadaceae bacterium KBTZ08]